MFNNQTPSTHQDQDDEDDNNNNNNNNETIRDIHPLTSPHPPPPPPPPPPDRHLGHQETWETTSHRSSSLSSENFTTMSREFNALVLAGTGILTGRETSEVNTNNGSSSSNLERIGEEVDMTENNNPLAIVRVDGNPSDLSVFQSVKKEEVESKISAWQNAKISKINNRFKRDDAIINGWENEQVQKSSSAMKKVETKLAAKRAHAMEKMENDIAKARRKAEERRATSEAKRGTKVARVMEVANLMRAIGRAPTNRSFF